MDFHVENGKVFSNMSSIKYKNVDTKLYHTSQKLGFVTIQRQNPLSCEVTNVTGRYMDTALCLTLTEVNLGGGCCGLTTQGTSYINHEMIDSLFVVGAVIN